MEHQPLVEVLTIAVRNVIPTLSQEPVENSVGVLAANAGTTPGIDWDISSSTITWYSDVAGFNLEVGERVVVSYSYEVSVSAASDVVSPSLITYSRVIDRVNVIPNLVHIPISSTFVVRVNDVEVFEDVDWTRDNHSMIWVAGYDLEIEDVIAFEYKKVK